MGDDNDTPAPTTTPAPVTSPEVEEQLADDGAAIVSDLNDMLGGGINTEDDDEPKPTSH